MSSKRVGDGLGKGVSNVAADNPMASESEKAEWLTRFARRSGLAEAEMIRTMKVEELTGE
jgi:hypothetical protein